MAAIAVAVRSTQALDRRIPAHATVRRRITAGEAGRNAVQATSNGRFTTPKARRKLKRLYPSSSVWSTTKLDFVHFPGMEKPHGISH
jgi:hypothetical protein